MNPETLPIGANDYAAIAAIVQDQAAAWNRADAEAFAERYSETGSFTNIAGLRIYGKAGFIEQHTRIFNDIFLGSHIVLTIDRVQLLSPEVAVVDLDAALGNLRQAPQFAKLGNDGLLLSRLQEVFTKKEGHWQIAAFHNVAVSQPLSGLGRPAE